MFLQKYIFKKSKNKKQIQSINRFLFVHCYEIIIISIEYIILQNSIIVIGVTILCYKLGTFVCSFLCIY